MSRLVALEQGRPPRRIEVWTQDAGGADAYRCDGRPDLGAITGEGLAAHCAAADPAMLLVIVRYLDRPLWRAGRR